MVISPSGISSRHGPLMIFYIRSRSPNHGPPTVYILIRGPDNNSCSVFRCGSRYTICDVWIMCSQMPSLLLKAACYLCQPLKLWGISFRHLYNACILFHTRKPFNSQCHTNIIWVSFDGEMLQKAVLALWCPMFMWPSWILPITGVENGKGIWFWFENGTPGCFFSFFF